MQSPRWWLLALGIAVTACGGRVSVGDLGTPNDMSGSGTTTSGQGDSTSTGNSTATGSSGAAGGFGAGGPYPTTGTAGSAGGPQYVADAATDGPSYSAFDGAVVQDVSLVGGAACGGIEYPATGFYGENILYPPLTWTTPGAQLEMAAKLAPGATLRIRITQVSAMKWGIGGDGDWRTTNFDSTSGQQLFEAKDTGRMLETTAILWGSGRARFEYFECGSATATGSKLVLWGNGISDSGVP